jgi:hypothetical protein
MRLEESVLTPTEVASLADGFRKVTGLIEDVGRTIEAQSQRSNRLMARFEELTRVLAVLPQEAERELEALDSLQQTVAQQRQPMHDMARSVQTLNEELGDTMPEMLRELRGGNVRMRDTLAETTRAMNGRFTMATLQADERERARFEVGERGRRKRFQMALAVGILSVAGLGVGGVFGMRHVIRESVSALAGQQVVSAHEESGNWMPVYVRQTDEAPASTFTQTPQRASAPEADATLPAEDVQVGPLAVDDDGGEPSAVAPTVAPQLEAAPWFENPWAAYREGLEHLSGLGAFMEPADASEVQAPRQDD